MHAVLALGSPHGDDQIGWVIADRLQARIGAECDGEVLIQKLATPWDALHIDGEFQSILFIDSAQIDNSTIDAHAGVPSETRPKPGPEPGDWITVSLAQLSSSPLSWRSTHGGSLVEVLRLAETLGRPWKHVEIRAVLIRDCVVGASLSPQLLARVDSYVRSLLDGLNEFEKQP